MRMFDILRAMDAYIGNDSGNDGDVICALADCDEAAGYTCVCCNRRVCWYDISGASVDEPGVCHECLTDCAGGIACQVVTR